MRYRNSILLTGVTCLAGMAGSLAITPHAAQGAVRAGGQGKVTTLAPGSAARKRLFDTIRPSYEKELHQKVIFTAPTLRVTQGWAFVTGTMRQPNGKFIDYSRTKFKEASKVGGISYNYCALLRSLPGNRWKLVTYHIGETDVFWEDWPQRFHAPAVLFKEPVTTQ